MKKDKMTKMVEREIEENEVRLEKKRDYENARRLRVKLVKRLGVARMELEKAKVRRDKTFVVRIETRDKHMALKELLSKARGMVRTTLAVRYAEAWSARKEAYIVRVAALNEYKALRDEVARLVMEINNIA